MYDSHSLTPSLIHIHIYSSLTSSVIWPADDGSSMYNTFYAATQMKERKKHTHQSKSQRAEKKKFKWNYYYGCNPYKFAAF